MFIATDKACDLRNVKTLLNDLSPNQYLDLGLELKVKKSDIETFETNNPKNAKRVLTEIISCWMRNDENYSWETLKTALININENTLASAI